MILFWSIKVFLIISALFLIHRKFGVFHAINFPTLPRYRLQIPKNTILFHVLSISNSKNITFPTLFHVLSKIHINQNRTLPFSPLQQIATIDLALLTQAFLFFKAQGLLRVQPATFSLL
jgi:hypothetical protein